MKIIFETLQVKKFDVHPRLPEQAPLPKADKLVL
jgi:hypothetical protein